LSTGSGRETPSALLVAALAVGVPASASRTDRITGVDPADVSSPYGFAFGAASWFAQS
jgi:hypothetical protein